MRACQRMMDYEREMCMRVKCRMLVTNNKDERNTSGRDWRGSHVEWQSLRRIRKPQGMR